jgi:hypothetical protein
MEWLELELTENGLRGLIWREKESQNPYIDEMKRIRFIFAFEDEETVLVTWSQGLSTVYHNNFTVNTFYYVNENNNLINYRQLIQFGSNAYRKCSFHFYEVTDELTLEFMYGLLANDLSTYTEEDLQWWYDNGHTKTEDGMYYRKIIGPWSDFYYLAIEKDQFMELFEEMTGRYFYDIMPDWK